MEYLDELESKSIYIIRESYRQFKKIAMLWSIGKDSTAMMWLVRKAFFDRIPFPVVHIDTSYKFPEMVKYRDQKAKEWGLELIVGKNQHALDLGMGPENKFDCCTALKTEALREVINKYGYRALLLGIRRDEHGIRAKERVFSPRNPEFQWDYKNQPPEFWDQFKSKVEDEDHIRVHPMLHWTEVDIWKYIKREKIPIIPLYFSDRGRRYRSIGCKCCCEPVESGASNVTEVIEELLSTNTSERAGRAQDKESAYTMQKLRALGYM